jgi:phosphoenolpyruvate carboxylase
VLAKTVAKEEATPTNTITASIPTVRNLEETIVDKPKEEETVKVEPRSASSYMTSEQDNKNFSNPFVTAAAVWQTSMTYRLKAYGEFLKNAPKMTEEWFNIFWKP